VNLEQFTLVNVLAEVTGWETADVTLFAKQWAQKSSCA